MIWLPTGSITNYQLTEQWKAHKLRYTKRKRIRSLAGSRYSRRVVWQINRRDAEAYRQLFGWITLKRKTSSGSDSLNAKVSHTQATDTDHLWRRRFGPILLVILLKDNDFKISILVLLSAYGKPLNKWLSIWYKDILLCAPALMKPSQYGFQSGVYPIYLKESTICWDATIATLLSYILTKIGSTIALADTYEFWSECIWERRKEL